MGLISKFRSHDSDRRKSGLFTIPKSPSIKTDVTSHTKASNSVSSSTSDFSHTSVSSASSQDSGNRNLEFLKKQQGHVQRSQNTQISLASMQAPNISESKKKRSSVSLISTQSAGITPRQRDSTYAPVHQRSMLNQSFSQDQVSETTNSDAFSEYHHQHPSLLLASSPQCSSQPRSSIQHTQSMLNINSLITQQASPPFVPPLAAPPHSVDISLSEGSGDSGDSGESSEVASDAESEFTSMQAQTHPYYDQWKQYYQALEQQRKATSQPAPSHHTKKVHPNTGASAPPHSAPLLASERFLSKASATNSRNSLLLNSRRSSVVTNRSASAPPQEHKNGKKHTRVTSLNVALSETEFPKHAESERDDENNDTLTSLEVSKPLFSSSTSAGARLQKLSLDENTTNNPLDDYANYALFLGNDADNAEAEPKHEAYDRYPQNQAVGGSRLASAVSQRSDVIDYYQTSDNSDQTLSKADAMGVSVDNSPLGLHRNTSANSYSSLQSEKDFNVGSSLRRVAEPSLRPPSPVSRKKSRGSIKKFTPPIAGPPPPLAPLAPVQSYPEYEVRRQLSFIKRQSTGTLPMSDMYMQQIQQQLQQLQHLQQLHQMHQFQQMQYGPSLMGPSKTALSNDSFINTKIDEFVQLRRIIASGNKTFEYRIKWLKLLISATNNKLYAYINIKGEATSSEQIAENKQYFIRSSVNHLSKLLKELGRSEREEGQRLFADACYIQGCLYSHAYLEKFGQDFNFELDYEEANRFFNLCLDNNPGYFRAYYGLGEIQEIQQDEEQFEAALENYTESAKMGYNKAIYKVALFHLLVPNVRSTRYFSLFKKLADIDLESSDVQLCGTDRDELEEVVGLAQFQLGKIYEGIYPSDLSPDDEFVQASLEIAPVSYTKSLSYYNKAAKLSCSQAQVKLGRVYENGELDRAYNPKKSVQWYMKASSSPLKYRRHPEAMLGLSRWLMKGTDGISSLIPHPEPELAVDWCERACQEFAYPEAYYQMGLLVEQGFAQGNPKEWFEQAYSGGHVQAGERLGVISQEVEH